MTKISLNLGFYRLFLTVKGKRQKVSGKNIHQFIMGLLEHKNLRKFLGTNLAIVTLVSSTIHSNPNTLVVNEESAILVVKDNPIETEKGFQSPVLSVKITQGFSFFHPGIDLDGTTGNPIRAAFPGIVEEIQNYKKVNHWNLSPMYGNAVIIDHGGGRKTLYAHLAKINVNEGQEVDLNTIIGEMGSTGRSTGSHLHFEIREAGKAINPLGLLPRS